MSVKIESEKMLLKTFEMQVLGKLSPEQLEIVSLFQRSSSITEVVNYYFSKGRLVSFVNILSVVRLLLAKQFVVNVNFYNYFNPLNLDKSSGIVNLLSDFGLIKAEPKKPSLPTATSKEILKNIPFFRSLAPQMVDLFLQNSSVVDVSSGITFCQEGASQRTLLVLLKGKATVYRKNATGSFERVVVLNEGSLFGEAGFFFGTPRSASVIADENCQVLVIKYIPEIFDGLIKTEVARDLQMRIWAIHALLKSEMFKDLPQDCFDALIFSGELKKIPSRKVVCKQGEQGHTCYVIIQGKVSVNKNLTLVKNLEQGDCFGELALLATGGVRTASVHTETDVILLEIHRNQFYKMLAENLLLAVQFEKITYQRQAK